MQVHVKAFHLNERPFACDKCDSKFAHKHLLARHKRLHDNPQPVAKKARKDAFVPPTLFESITGDRPGPRNFACQFPDCSLSYKRAYDLDRHYKAVHSKEMQQSEYLDSSFDPLGCTTPPLLLPLNAMELYPPSSLVSPTHIMDQNLLIAGDMISPSPSPPPELMESEDLLILSASSSDMTYSKASEFPGYGVPNGMIRAADSEYIPSQGTFGYLIDPLLMDPSARS